MASQIHSLIGNSENSILPVLLALALIILTAKFLGALANRLGQPTVLGELLAGLLLGPTFVDLLSLSFFEGTRVDVTIKQFAEIGVILLMFTAGLEVELSDLRRAGTPAIMAGLLGVLAPLGLGTGLGLIFDLGMSLSVFIGIVASATSVSISAQTLMELGRLRSREGATLLGAAVIDDIVVIMVLSGFLVITGGEGSIQTLALQLGKMILVLLLVSLFAFVLMPRVAELSNRLRVSEGLIAVTLALVLLLAWATEYFGSVASITGAFIAGLGLRGSHLRDEIEDSVHSLSFGFFVPIFLADIGLRADIGALEAGGLLFATALLVVAVFSKILGSGSGAWAGGMHPKAALRIGTGMISRGEVGLIVAGVGITEGILPQAQFTHVVLMVLGTTILTPVLLRWLYRNGEAING